MSDRLRAVLREPLTHFVLIGITLFAVDALVSGRAAPAAEAEPIEPRTPIVVDAGVRDRLAAQWALTHARPPSGAELASLVEDWIDQEVLYREGLRRGLDEGDLQVRDRVASQMAYVLGARAPAAAPSDAELEAELEAWFEEHRERYATPDRVDFTQVFIDGKGDEAEARARSLLALLRGGADPDGLGDRFSGGRRFRGRKLADLAVRFGDAFIEGLEDQDVGTWALRRSVEGTHLVRVDRWTAGAPPRYEALREQVRHDWDRAQREEALRRATAELRAAWEVHELP